MEKKKDKKKLFEDDGLERERAKDVKTLEKYEKNIFENYNIKREEILDILNKILEYLIKITNGK